MHKFDTKVQYLKYKVLREVARQAWNDTLLDNVLDIPKMIVPGKVPTMRCCVYKERAILTERVKLAMGGGCTANIINVIDIACDDCPAVGYQVTDKVKINAAYFQTNYENYDMDTPQQNMAALGLTIPAGKNSFTRTNRVVGIGVELTL